MKKKGRLPRKIQRLERMGTGWRNKLGKTSTEKGAAAAAVRIPGWRNIGIRIRIPSQSPGKSHGSARGTRPQHRGKRKRRSVWQSFSESLLAGWLTTLEVIFKVCTRFKRKRWRQQQQTRSCSNKK